MKSKSNSSIRINKYIALCGASSRRGADLLIREGKVRVNGKTIRDFGIMINPHTDVIFVENKPLKAPKDFYYLLFHKPHNVVTTMSEPEGRPCIGDYLKRSPVRLFPVGRLDWDTEGMVLLTNDGTFAQKVAHPHSTVPKTYNVKLNGQPTDEQLNRLVKGVTIATGKAKALAVSKLEARGSKLYDWVKIIITEGRNRQVRNMFAKIGYDVKKLQRVAIGSLKIGSLERGKLKVLSEEDLAKIFKKPKELVRLEKE